MHVEPHHTAEELAELVRAQPLARVARRLAAVRLALLRCTAPPVAEQVLLSERSVRAWVARYNAGGPDALADRPGRGREASPTDDQEQRLKDRAPHPGARVRRGPLPAGGLRPAAPARVRAAPPPAAAPRADPAAQDRFKTASRVGSPRPPRPTPDSGSRCGPRTRRGSARRGR
jgi:hypothetical protein